MIAFREVGEWKFVKPVFIGDTIHVDMEVMETKAFPRLGGGLVTLNVYVNNQSNETAMKGLWTVLVKTRGKSRAETGISSSRAETGITS